MATFKRIHPRSKFEVTIQKSTDEPITSHEIGQTLLEVEMAINKIVVESRDPNILIGCRMHIKMSKEVE